GMDRTSVYVTVPPVGTLSVSEMLPEPELCSQEASPVVAHVQVPLVPLGKRSVTSVPGAFEGPLFETTIVYVVELPGTAEATPSVFVIDKSVCEACVSVSVAVLLPGVTSITPAGAVIVAVLTRFP